MISPCWRRAQPDQLVAAGFEQRVSSCSANRPPRPSVQLNGTVRKQRRHVQRPSAQLRAASSMLRWPKAAGRRRQASVFAADGRDQRRDRARSCDIIGPHRQHLRGGRPASWRLSTRSSSMPHAPAMCKARRRARAWCLGEVQQPLGEAQRRGGARGQGAHRLPASTRRFTAADSSAMPALDDAPHIVLQVRRAASALSARSAARRSSRRRASARSTALSPRSNRGFTQQNAALVEESAAGGRQPAIAGCHAAREPVSVFRMQAIEQKRSAAPALQCRGRSSAGRSARCAAVSTPSKRVAHRHAAGIAISAMRRGGSSPSSRSAAVPGCRSPPRRRAVGQRQWAGAHGAGQPCAASPRLR